MTKLDWEAEQRKEAARRPMSDQQWRDKAENRTYTQMLRAAEAREAAFTYDGDFAFMLDMRRLARTNPSWLPTNRQAKAIMRCVARE